MANFNQLMQIANDSNFKNRVNFCMIKAAISVMAEAPNTASHQSRVEYARNILLGNVSTIQYSVGVVTNGTISVEAVLSTTPDFAVPDSDIEFVVNSIFNAYAGVIV